MQPRRLRILAIGYSTSTHVINRVRCFAERGHEVSLLTDRPVDVAGISVVVPAVRANQDRWVATLANVLGRLLCRNVQGLADTVRLLLDFRRLVSAARPDVVHVHYAYAAWAWMAAALGVRPLVVSIMGGDVLFDEQGSPTRRGIALTKSTLAAADLITAKSDYLIGVLDRIGGFGAKAIRIVWGVDPQVFRPVDAGDLRGELGIPADARVVLSPKILQPFYNVDVLVEAMARVADREPRAHLVVTEYGADPEYRAELLALIERLGIARHVTFVGHIEHERMPALYGLAEVAVGIPRSDGLPQTLLEAMACGVPNVVGPLDRYGEIVQHEDSALLSAIDPDSVAAAISRLLVDEGLYRRLAERGRAIVVEQASFPVDVRRVEEAYHELSAGRTRLQIPNPMMMWNLVLYWLGR